MQPWKIDFSEFHPLDHKPFTTECRVYPGGSRRHLRLGWEHGWGATFRAVGYRFGCMVGRHKRVKAQLHDPATKTYESAWMCLGCGHTTPRERDDWDLPVEDGGEAKWWWTPWDD